MYMKDTQGRNINYLRISVTDRCNLRCRYCMPETGIEKQEHDEILSLEEIFEVVKACAELGIDKVRITGGEPLVRKGLVSLIENINTVSSIKEITLTTNGILLERYANDLKKAGVNRVNISLDTLDSEKFKSITRGGSLETVLRGIHAAREADLKPIKINTVLIGGFNDDEIEALVKLTTEYELDVRFIELMPIGQAAHWAQSHFIPNSTVLDRVPDLQEIACEDKSSPAMYYQLPGAKGKVGLINPISHQFCGSCNRIRLTSDGKLKPCLNSNQEIDVRSLLRNELEGAKADALKKAVAEAIHAKPASHTLYQEEMQPIERDMFRIGG